MITNIVIVGGGSAGWATAHQFINKTYPSVKITLVATPEIPIVGVGESTTGRFNDLINLSPNITGVNEKDFLKETASTFKLGIKHSNWHTKGKHFYSPIGDDYSGDWRYPHPDYDNIRISHIADEEEYINTYQSQCMANDKLHFYNGTSVYEKLSSFPVAYHLDTYKVGQYLKRTAIGCKDKFTYIDGTINTFTQDGDGFVTALILEDGREVEGDLFIDCSGFHRVLINKVEENKFLPYSDNLLVNSAICYNLDYEEGQPIRSYTHAWAQKYGWIWEIPTQERLGCGYVFSNNHTSFDKAVEEVEGVLGKKINVWKEMTFQSGRVDKVWVKNVLSTGLATSFVEPLEATSIHATMMQITHFIENYYKPSMNFKADYLRDQYNSEMGTMWDDIRDFITYHYITPRNDTKFWTDSSSKERWTPRLTRLMNMWKHRMPRVVDYIRDKHNNFYNIGNVLWYQIGIGMKLFDPKIAKQELEDYGLYEESKKQKDVIKNLVQKVKRDCMGTNEYYNSL